MQTTMFKIKNSEREIIKERVRDILPAPESPLTGGRKCAMVTRDVQCLTET